MASGPLHTRFVPKGLGQHAQPLEQHLKRRRKQWKRHAEEDAVPQPKIKYKTTYRVKARDERGHDVFFKTRTKNATSTIRRLLSRANLTSARITI